MGRELKKEGLDRNTPESRGRAGRKRTTNINGTVIKASARASLEFTASATPTVIREPVQRTFNLMVNKDVNVEEIVVVPASELTGNKPSYVVIMGTEPPSVDQDNKERLSLNTLMFLGNLIFPRETRDAELGDLEERYNKNNSRFGSTRAKKILISDLCRSVVPHVGNFLRKCFGWLLKLVGVRMIIKFFLG